MEEYNRPAIHGGRYQIEWLLFMLVAFLSLREAWMAHEGNTYEFFWGAWDGMGYYQWLPSAFITHEFDWMFWCHKIGEGKAISLFSLGVSVLQLPFFLLAQWLTWVFGYPNTGFNPVNALCMMAATATYAGAGMVLSFKLAQHFSNTRAALLAVISIYAASNLFYYTAQEPLMSHVYSLFLVTLFCWCGLQIINGPKSWHVFAFLFSGALLVLVRQLNIIVWLFPLWMAKSSPKGVFGAWRNLKAHHRPLILGVCLGAIPWLLQMAYWHHITGQWYANGYSFKEEYFDFVKMVPGMVLFSPRNGWFVFSPVFLPIMAVLLVHAWRNTRTARPILVIFIFIWLMYSAWWCWWLGGGFGHRGFIDLYGLLAIPAAWLFRKVLRSSVALRVFTMLLLVALVRMNFGLAAYREKGRYWDADSTWPRLLSIMGDVAAGK